MEMREMISVILHDPEMAAALAASGVATILARHTCAHRVAELMDICLLCRRATSTG
jgi:spore maturation protein CgeB